MPQYQRSDGSLRIIVNYTDIYGNYKKKEKVYQKIKKNSKQAKLLEAELLKSTQKNQFESPITFEELITKYVISKEMEIRKATLEKDLRTIRIHISPFFEKMKISNITPAVIQEFKSQLNEKYNQKDPTKKLSTSYKWNIFKLLKTILEYATDVYNLPYNPAKKIKNFGTTNLEIEEELHFLTLEDFNIFSTQLKSNAITSGKLIDWDKYVFFNLLFFCGLRKSEAYAIRWNRINDNCVSIRTGIVQKIKGVSWEENPPKNKSSIRKIPLSNNLIQLLKEHKERWNKVYGFAEDWFICGGYNPMTDSTVENCNTETLKLCKLSHIRIHDYRHSFASLLINANVNIKTISKLMGHATVEQTWNRYGHLYPEAENIAINEINKMVQS